MIVYIQSDIKIEYLINLATLFYFKYIELWTE